MRRVDSAGPVAGQDSAGGDAGARSRRSSIAVTVVLVLLACCWVLVPAVLVELASVSSGRLFGVPPNPFEQQRAVHLVRLALLFLVALPAVALGVALGWRRRTASVLFAVGTALALAVAVFGVTAVRDAGGTSAPRPAEPSHCQERSGGGTECPGG